MFWRRFLNPITLGAVGCFAVMETVLIVTGRGHLAVTNVVTFVVAAALGVVAAHTRHRGEDHDRR